MELHVLEFGGRTAGRDNTYKKYNVRFDPMTETGCRNFNCDTLPKPHHFILCRHSEQINIVDIAAGTRKPGAYPLISYALGMFVAVAKVTGSLNKKGMMGGCVDSFTQFKNNAWTGGMMAKQEPTTIRGIVLAAGWEKNGRISTVDIAGYDERTYRVVNDAIGKKLLDHVKRQVVALGRVTMRENRLCLYVSHFQIEDFDSQHFRATGEKER
jgi:hypothetical protein